MSKSKPQLLSSRYKLQRGKVIVTFEVDGSDRMTFFTGINSRQPKDYHFQDSDPDVVIAVAKLITEAAQFVKKGMK